MELEPEEMLEVAAALERHAQQQAAVVKQVIREYHKALAGKADGERLEKQREVGRVVAQYMQVQKRLARIHNNRQ